MDMRTAARIGRSGHVSVVQYSEHIRLRLVTTMHSSRPHCCCTCTPHAPSWIIFTQSH